MMTSEKKRPETIEELVDECRALSSRIDLYDMEGDIANEELAGKSMADAANKAVDWALDHLKDGDEIACEHFKP